MSELPKNIKELRRHFPKVIPAKFKQEIEENARQPILFCTDRTDSQKAICTKCGKVVLKNSYSTHKGQAICPKCNREALVIHLWRGVRYRQDILSYHYAKSVIDPNVITCTVLYTAHIYKSSHPWKEKPFQVVDARYVFVPGKGAIMLADADKIYWGGIVYKEGKAPTYCFKPKPTIRPTIHAREGKYANMGVMGPDLYIPSKDQVMEAVEGTSIKYAFEAYKDVVYLYDDDRFIKILEWICRFPTSMEYLAKIGFDYSIYHAIKSGHGLCGAFNMKGTTLDVITGGRLTKQEKEYILQHTHEVSIRDFQCFRRLKKTKYGRKISLEQIVKQHLGYSETNYCKLLKYVDYEKLNRYLDKQRGKHPDVHIDIGFYVDYIRGCEILGADMTSKATLWPSDLYRIHNNQQPQIKLIMDQAEKDKKQRRKQTIEDKYQRRKKALIRKYSYENESMGFAVVVPDQVHDLIREGTEQHICVGTYVERVAKGDTNVVYLRKISAPDKSYGTIEISKDNRIIQVRGKYNRNLPPDAMDFIKEFEKVKIKKERKAA